MNFIIRVINLLKLNSSHSKNVYLSNRKLHFVRMYNTKYCSGANIFNIHFFKNSKVNVLARNTFFESYRFYKQITLNFSSCDGTTVLKAENIINDIIDTTPSSAQNVGKEDLVKVLDILFAHGVRLEDIKKHLSVLLLPAHCSYVKALLLGELNGNMAMMLPLITLSIPTLRKAIKRAKEDEELVTEFPDRISYLCHHLELTPNNLVNLLSKHPCLLTMKFSRLECKINILKNAKISPEYIVKDLWIFNYNEKLLVERISAAQLAGISVKPWLLRCSKNVFTSVLIKWEQTQHILKGDHQTSYLAKKLNCMEEYVEQLLAKNKSFAGINIVKFEKVTEFLYGKGYTPEEVCSFPKVFSSSIETLSERFEEFFKIKGSRPTLPILCISSKRYCKKIVKK